MTKMIEAAFLTIALPRGIDEGEIARLVGARSFLIIRRKMKAFERHGDFLGKADSDKTAGCDRIAVAYQANGFLRADDSAAFERLQPFAGAFRQCVRHVVIILTLVLV